MLIRSEEIATDACESCPIDQSLANYYISSIQNFSSYCKICQTFVGLKYKNTSPYRIDDGINLKCPCARPGKIGAVARAWKHITKYEEKHGEIKI